MPRYMFDTNMCIYLMKQQPERVVQRFEQCRVGDVVMSSERKTDMLDKLIAAHAIALQLPLVTNNVKDFRSFPGITLQNWMEEAA